MTENLGQTNRSIAAHEAMFTESLKETQAADKELSTALEANKTDASLETLQTEAEENSAMGIMIKTQKLVRKQEIKTEKAKHAQKSVLVRKEDADGLAGDFSRRQGNREYRIDPLNLSLLAAEELGESIHPTSTPEEIIAIIRRRMTDKGEAPDVAIVDKAFEFLLEVTTIQLRIINETDKPRLKAIYDKLESAKNLHFESHTIEIQVAQKIIGAVDAIVENTGETVKVTLDRYRDVVHNPPELQTLRKYYESKGYKAMVLELKGLSTYLGGNLKRTNLENPELAQLAAAARTMQALLGVYRQSKAHIPTMESYLELNGILIASG